MCTESGRQCQGYTAPLDGRTREAREARTVNQRGAALIEYPRQQLAPATGLIRLTDGSQISLSPIEREYLHSFRSRTAVQCAGFGFDPFWQILVHQASESYPVVSHAVIAISALHQQFVDPVSNQNHMFAIGQCNKAIGHLRSGIMSNAYPDSAHTEIILIACVVLIAFGLFQGDVEAVRCHLRSGTKMLYEWRKGNGKKSAFAPILLHTFVQLHIHWATVTGFKDHIRGEYPYLGELMSENLSDISAYAEKNERARTTLLLSVRAWMVMITDHTQSKGQTTNLDEMEDFLLDVPSKKGDRFQAQLENCVAVDKHTASPTEERAALMVKINRETFQILDTGTKFSGGETEWDALLPHFEAIVDTTETLLTSFGQLPDMSFSVKEGFIGSLMLCGIKCRNWPLRQRVTRIFQKYKRREGVSSTAESLAILNRVYELESAWNWPNCPIPESHRITMVIVEEHANYSHPKPKVHLKYQDGKRKWQSEWLTL
jgi:hypothetical protein